MPQFALAIASRTNPCTRSVERDSPEHNKAFYRNMSHTAHSEVERSSSDSRSRNGSGISCANALRPDHFGPSQT